MKTHLTLASILVLAACGGGSQPAPPPATAAPATQAAGPAAVSGFGVPECDAYMAKYQACIESKVPEAARGMIRQQLEQTRDAWQKAATTPEGKAGLAMGCKAATDAAKTGMAAYGCAF